VLVGVLAGVLLSLNFSRWPSGSGAFPLPVDELRAFAEVFGAIKSSYVEPVEDKKLITEAISGMLTGSIRTRLIWTRTRSASSRWAPRANSAARHRGRHGRRFVKVVSPIEDTPAFRAGLKPGDFIIKIDDTSVKGMTLNDAVKRMRGSEDDHPAHHPAQGDAKPSRSRLRATSFACRA